jgi:hypothetical protein
VAGDGDVILDEPAVYDLLNSPDGPVGRLLLDLSEQAAAVARAKVRVRVPGSNRTGLTSSARPPGFTLASISPKIGYDDQGLIYGGVVAAGDPGIFLEYPAEQMHREYPFLTTGLDSLEL